MYVYNIQAFTCDKEKGLNDQNNIMTQQSRLLELANTIHQQTISLHKLLQNRHEPEPSFEGVPLNPTTPDLIAFQNAIIDAASELQDLLLPPLDLLYKQSAVSFSLLLR
jgi:hypothetical protein